MPRTVSMYYQTVEQRLKGAIREGRKPAARDIAWMQQRDLVKLFELSITRLDDATLKQVEAIYAPHGGLHGGLQGTFFLPLLPDIPVNRNSAIHIGATDDHGQQSKKRKIEDVPPVIYHPNQRLKTRYGILNVDENSKRGVEPIQAETADIDKDEIPIGTYAHDPEPARLVTATINSQSRELHFTAQCMNKDFVRVDVEGRQTDEDIDFGHINFVHELKDKSYNDVLRYVFEELRKEGEFDNLWASCEDMLQYPDLPEVLRRLREFTHDPNVPKITANSSLDAAIKQFDESNSVLKSLGSAIEQHDKWLKDNLLHSRNESRRRKLVEDTMNCVWKSVTRRIEHALRIRAGHEKDDPWPGRYL